MNKVLLVLWDNLVNVVHQDLVDSLVKMVSPDQRVLSVTEVQLV